MEQVTLLHSHPLPQHLFRVCQDAEGLVAVLYILSIKTSLKGCSRHKTSGWSSKDSRAMPGMRHSIPDCLLKVPAQREF
ncbi:hypothetical protein AAFF_G00249720 [Aldrovandia affinis]|uniref:Uncharacterized protein n=1 Tax=Aldrovandia affinis TaxID=143900 RepID=A0AAD7RD09_9TELE|nr:hypothetical protein AAFF_G00249720 [Aldrovandia affinis]